MADRDYSKMSDEELQLEHARQSGDYSKLSTAQLEAEHTRQTSAGQYDWMKDIGKSAVSGLGEAASFIGGLKGDAENLGAWAGEKIGGLFGKPPLTEEKKKELGLTGIRKAPTSEEVQKEVNKVIPEYTPEGLPGRLTKNVASFAGGALLGPSSALRTVVAPGLLSQGLKEGGAAIGFNPSTQNALYTAGGMLPALRSGLGNFPTARNAAQDVAGRAGMGALGYFGSELAGYNTPEAKHLATLFGLFSGPRVPGVGRALVGRGPPTNPSGDVAAFVRAMQGSGQPSAPAQ